MKTNKAEQLQAVINNPKVSEEMKERAKEKLKIENEKLKDFEKEDIKTKEKFKKQTIDSLKKTKESKTKR